jgi:hypothetical protein
MQLPLFATLASALAFSPVPIAAHASTPGSLTLRVEHRHSAARENTDVVNDLQVAEQRANEDPAGGLAGLRAALDRVEELGFVVAGDPKAHEARMYGLLALARAHLSLGQDDEAREIMDEAIRVARGDSLPTKTFGPRLIELHDSRLAAPENRPLGQLVVECTPACDVLLNARIAGSGRRVELSNVPLGPHRVRVQATAGGEDDLLDQRIVLTENDPAAKLEIAPATKTAPVGPEETKLVEDVPDAAQRRRMLPRWAGIVGVATGAVAMIAGGVLLGLDGRCPDGSDPSSAECINVLSTKAPGIALLAVGGAAFAGFGVVLIVDETRVRRGRTAGAMLGYTLRF